MARRTGDGTSNAQRRTRKHLLEAAARLLRGGRAPTIDEVAAEAMVSRATVYRYFPSIEALVAEAPIDQAVPAPHELFAGDRSKDPVQRLDRAEGVLHEVSYRNAPALRAMLAASLQRPPGAGAPLRQSRRTGLIDAALAPVRDRLNPSQYRRLRAALCLVFGTESMIVFTDILGLTERDARAAKRWMIGALVAAALGEPGGTRTNGPRQLRSARHDAPRTMPPCPPAAPSRG